MFSKKDILRLSEDDWRKQSFLKFEQKMLDPNNKFPCVFGSRGFEKDELRFCFFDDVDEQSIIMLSSELREYLSSSRDFGKYTSFVTFFNIDRNKSIKQYEEIFWSILNKLHELDEKRWNPEISIDPDEALWEFCFHGEPIFVVCGTPAHKLRRSRHSDTFMITFQPRWVFESIGLGTPRGEKSKKAVRNLLQLYDDIEEYPYLGTFGDENNREWLQYFIPETNQIKEKKCPFHFHENNQEREVKVIHGAPVSLSEAIMELLPETGSVEVQRDTPFREHKPHTHPTDETLLIVSGEITFYSEGKEFHCTSGSRLLLPAETVHSSKAGEQGCLYIIAFEFVRTKREMEHSYD